MKGEEEITFIFNHLKGHFSAWRPEAIALSSCLEDLTPKLGLELINCMMKHHLIGFLSEVLSHRNLFATDHFMIMKENLSQVIMSRLDFIELIKLVDTYHFEFICEFLSNQLSRLIQKPEDLRDILMMIPCTYKRSCLAQAVRELHLDGCKAKPLSFFRALNPRSKQSGITYARTWIHAPCKDTEIIDKTVGEHFDSLFFFQKKISEGISVTDWRDLAYFSKLKAIYRFILGTHYENWMHGLEDSKGGAKGALDYLIFP